MFPPTRDRGCGGGEGGGGGATSVMIGFESPSAITPLAFGKSSFSVSIAGSGVMASGTVIGGTSGRGVSTFACEAARGGAAGGSGSGTTWMNSVAVLGAGNSSVAHSGAMTAAHTAMTWTTIEIVIVQVRISLLYGGRAGVALM